MATTLTLKKTLHRPQWEMCNPLPAANAAGSFARALRIPAYKIDEAYFCINTTSQVYAWDPVSDTEQLLPSSGLAGTFGAGSCGKIVPLGPSGTATAGSTTTLTTNLTIPRDLRGYRIRITGGPGAGDERIIASNTLGANSVITVTTAFSATITSSSTYLLLTPRLWVFNPAATPGLGYWDFALSAWTVGRSVTGVTFTGTDGVINSTASLIGNITDSQDSVGSTATFGSATATVLTLSAGRAWTTNQWQYGVITVVGGTGAGQSRIIASNTDLTVTFASMSTPMDSTSVWTLTKAFASSGSNSAVFSACTTTVLTLTGVNWTTNQWANYQIRAISGTGAGQVRSIASNTATTLTVSVAMTAFDATTIWVIEGNDDYLYLAGNAAVALFRYSISGNAWTTATATAARAAVTGAGLSLNWITSVNDSAWTNENAIKNGRYLYSFRGAAGAVLDYYDIALTTWTSGVTYANAAETFTTGCCYEYDGGQFIWIAQAATGRFFYFDVLLNSLEQGAEYNYVQGAAIVGDKLFMVKFYDGSTVIPFIYHWSNTSQALFRTMLWYLY